MDIFQVSCCDVNINYIFHPINRMLDYLKKQVFEYRSKNFLLRSDLNELKNAHNNLLEQYSGLSSSYEALRQHSSTMTKSNKKMLNQSTESKKELFEMKKELKVSLFNHKAELRKLSDLMKAKDKDNAETISRLQAEVASYQSISRTHLGQDFNRHKPRPSNTSLSSQARTKSESVKKNESSLLQQAVLKKKISPTNGRTRAKFGRKSPTNMITPIVSMDDEQWGHDKYFAMNGSSARSSPVSVSSSNSFSSRRQSIHRRRRTKKSTSNKMDEKNIRVVSPRERSSQPSRNLSTSSLKEATTKKKSNDNGAKKSSLATAATKKSSLAMKVKSTTKTK